MGSARKREAAKREEHDPSGDRRKHSTERAFPPEAYVSYDEVTKEAVEAIQRRADAELAGDDLEVIEGDGSDH